MVVLLRWQNVFDRFKIFLGPSGVHPTLPVFVLTDAYGFHEARRGFGRWRLFFLACAELFGYRGGTEWFVSHVLLVPREAEG